MGTLVRSQRGVLIASLVTLVLAAACEVAVPHYSSRALNAAAFAQDRVVSGSAGMLHAMGDSLRVLALLLLLLLLLLLKLLLLLLLKYEVCHVFRT